MALSTADFVKIVGDEVQFRLDSYSHVESEAEAFAQWSLELLFPDLDSDTAASRLVHDARLDASAIHIDEDSGTVYLVVSHYTGSASEFGRGVVQSIFQAAEQLTDMRRSASGDSSPASEGQSPVIEAVNALREEYTLTPTLVILGALADEEHLPAIAQEYGYEEDAVLFCDLQRLRRIYTGSDEYENHAPIKLPFLSQAPYDGPVEACVANVTASAFVDGIQERVPNIYDANLRVPLKTSKVNKQISGTLKSAEQSRFFWYYNNGVTMLCRGFSIENGNLLSIDAPRIVNGAQTTDSLIHAAPFDGEAEVSILVRVIAALPGSEQVAADLSEPGLLDDLHLDIARFTNSQNPIQIPDFRSNDLVQKKIHEGFQTLGYFYEHRRGQWESFANKRQFRGKRVKMVDLAQRWFAFAGHPASAIREKLSLFDEQGSYGSIFSLNRPPELYLIAYLIFDQLQSLIRDEIRSAKEKQKRLIQSGGTLSVDVRNYLLIGRATKLAVAHMTTLVHDGLRKYYGELRGGVLERVFEAVESEKLIRHAYPDLVDALFRLATTLKEEQHRTMHNLLSDRSALAELSGLFSYVLEKEEARGRHVLPVDGLQPQAAIE